MAMNEDQRNELLFQMLEHEKGGVKVYRTALECVQNEELKEEFEEYLEQTEHHVEVLTELFQALGLDPATESPGREIVRKAGAGLVELMELARSKGDPSAAQLVAAECVVLAETKDHMNWQLLGEVAKKATGAERKALKEAYDEVEDEEDEHLYHSAGWARELWLESLGLPAVLPPPEEEKDVKTAIGAARAKAARKEML